MLTDGHPSPHGTLKHSSSRKISSSISHKDLWLISREGSLAELDSALSSLKKNGGNIDARNAFGLTALHIATWRNNVPIVKRLLDAGADPDARDGESGWSSLHRALHFGHLAVASVLIQSGAALTLEDSKHRIPVDLISGPVLQTTGTGLDMVSTELFSWGSGTNYQLGTGNAHIQKLPCKVDALQGSYIKLISSAKFHSVAIGNNGELYTWGFGRGGRLGHPDFDIHSGQAAVITPRQVTVGLGSRRVKAVAAAKHHTVIAIENGEVFTWGSNREGQLGYTSVDTQPTPRRVSSLRSRIIAVAAANKHSAAISDMGEVFTWGCNKEGQLGYGTSSSASNYTPRLVEYLKGKVFTQISAAKYHTIVLSKEGEIFTWGHRLVTPKRVIIARTIKKSGNVPLKFHRMERLHVVSVAAGVVHSTALIDDGTLFYWVSSDPDLRCQQLYNMCGKNLVSISAGKYWTAVVSKTGDVYMWDGKKNKTDTPVPARLHGIKQATSVSVGETHLLAVCTLYYPTYPPKMDVNSKHAVVEVGDSLEELDEDFMFNDIQPNRKPTSTQLDVSADKSVPSLKSLCEKTAIEFMLEPRNAVQLLEVADSLAADGLRSYCEEMALRNLSYIFAVSTPTISNASPDVLAMLEKSLDARSSESWSYRQLPTLTATFPAVIDVEDEGIGDLRLRDNHSGPMPSDYSDARSDCFLRTDKDPDKAITKQVRALKKKLQQIDMLEEKKSKGHLLDDQQLLKLQTRTELEIALASLGFPVERESTAPSLVVTEGKGRKQRKNKQKAAQVNPPIQNETCEEMEPIKSLLNIRTLQTSEQKEDISINLDDRCALLEDFPHQSPRGTPKKSANSYTTPKQAQSKKKNKKGGLSLFLSGALDDNPKTIAPPPPPTPKKEGPAWGGAKIAKGPTSLRDIQDEQIKTKVTSPSKSKEIKPLELIGSETLGHIQLSSFLPPPVSSPVAIISSRTVVVIADVEKSTPPWSSTGMSPVSSRPSLRDIQIQQEKKHSMSHSPQTRTTGFTISSGTVSSPETPTRAKDATPNRWFKPETDAPSSIRSIQIEEKAMKDLKRYYTNVRLVRAQPQGS